MATKKGYLDAFFETGTEGIIWAIDERLPDPKYPGYFTRDGLHFLKSGQKLKIFSPEDGSVIWEGSLKLSKKLSWLKTEENGEGQNIAGYWISPMSGVQEDVDPLLWLKWFGNGYLAELETP